MTGIFHVLAAALSCAIVQQPVVSCIPYALTPEPQVAQAQTRVPKKTGDSIDVALTAHSALVWDVATDTILYDKQSTDERPIASINKLLSTLTVRELLPNSNTVVAIPPEVRKIQAKGANIKLPVGEHASVRDLLEASLIPSANDAMATLAIAAKGSEDAFAQAATEFGARHGLFHTKLANATGLHGGDQHSTARDVQKMLMMAYQDPVLRPYLSQQKGSLTTTEGSVRQFTSTDELIGTYMTILAGKTGYTLQAKENLAIITVGPRGQKIGAVILGSDARFQDTKTVVEWVIRNYTWP